MDHPDSICGSLAISLDKDPCLAEVCIQKGWVTQPLFKLHQQLGRKLPGVWGKDRSSILAQITAVDRAVGLDLYFGLTGRQQQLCRNGPRWSRAPLGGAFELPRSSLQVTASVRPRVRRLWGQLL